MNSGPRRPLTIPLPSLDGPTAAWLVEVCGHLQHALWLAYGDQIEAHWTATQPGQPIYGPLQSRTPRKR